MGGAAALRVLADAPERVTAVVGISTGPRRASRSTADSEALFTGAENEDGNRYAILDFTTGNRQSATWLNQMTEFSVEHTDAPGVRCVPARVGRGRFRDALPQTSIRSRRSSASTIPRCGAETMKATWMAQLPQCELDVLANAGHYAMFEAPVALITSMEAVLSELK